MLSKVGDVDMKSRSDSEVELTVVDERVEYDSPHD